MPEASSLRDLLRIRQANAGRLRRIPGYLGSAVGYKYHEDSDTFARDEDGAFIPAVLVFVRRKRPLDSIPPAERVPERLKGPKRLSCVTDVVTGALPAEAPEPRPFTAANRRLLRKLHEDEMPWTGGMPIASRFGTGTAACVVRRGRTLGFLTNWHVAGFPGSRIVRPSPRLSLAGWTARADLYAKHTRSKRDLESYIDRKTTRHRLDAAFIPFAKYIRKRDTHSGVHGLGPLGKPWCPDLDTMEPIGTRVVGVGQKLGLQRGAIAAYGYEWRIDPEDEVFHVTDYLILGEGRQPFAAAGDSGKLVVTDDEDRRPIALLWGGQRQGFWSAEAQESWAYASRIDTVLKQLKLEIVR